jgi:hypothetical protein
MPPKFWLARIAKKSFENISSSIDPRKTIYGSLDSSRRDESNDSKYILLGLLEAELFIVKVLFNIK